MGRAPSNERTRSQGRDGRAGHTEKRGNAPAAAETRPQTSRRTAPGQSPRCRTRTRQETNAIKTDAHAAPPLKGRSQDLVRSQFGPRAEQYVESPDHAQGESLDRMLELVRPKRSWRALDIATGGGHTALALAPHVREVVATDITDEMLRAAERFIRGKGVANVSFGEADAMKLPFDGGSFDLVTCRIAPHHFSDCARFVREAARVLCPGGVAAVVDNVVPDDPEAAAFINEFERLRDPSHHRAYSRREWVGFFTDAGLIIEHVETFRKARDFDRWAGRMGVGEALRSQLRALLAAAPVRAAEALAPETAGERLQFHLSEVLIVARQGG